MVLRGHSGGPWEQQDGFGMVVYKILLDFGVPILKVLGAEACNLNFCRFVSRSLFSESEFQFWGLLNLDCRFECTAKNNFSHKLFFMNSTIVFSRFCVGPGSSFSVFLCLGNRLRNLWLFGDVTDSKPGEQGW